MNEHTPLLRQSQRADLTVFQESVAGYIADTAARIERTQGKQAAWEFIRAATAGCLQCAVDHRRNGHPQSV